MGGILFKDFCLICGECKSTTIENYVETYPTLENKRKKISIQVDPRCEKCGSRQIIIQFNPSIQPKKKSVSLLYSSLFHYRPLQLCNEFNSEIPGPIHFLWPEIINEIFPFRSYYWEEIDNRSPILITRISDQNFLSQVKKKYINCFWTIHCCFSTDHFDLEKDWEDYSISGEWENFQKPCRMFLPVGLRIFRAISQINFSNCYCHCYFYGNKNNSNNNNNNNSKVDHKTQQQQILLFIPPKVGFSCWKSNQSIQISSSLETLIQSPKTIFANAFLEQRKYWDSYVLQCLETNKKKKLQLAFIQNVSKCEENYSRASNDLNKKINRIENENENDNEFHPDSYLNLNDCDSKLDIIKIRIFFRLFWYYNNGLYLLQIKEMANLCIDTYQNLCKIVRTEWQKDIMYHIQHSLSEREIARFNKIKNRFEKSSDEATDAAMILLTTCNKCSEWKFFSPALQSMFLTTATIFKNKNYNIHQNNKLEYTSRKELLQGVYLFHTDYKNNSIKERKTNQNQNQNQNQNLYVEIIFDFLSNEKCNNNIGICTDPNKTNIQSNIYNEFIYHYICFFFYS